jgi:hypothetical protein
MIQVLFGVLEAGLSLWSDKEKHKYVDRLLRLKEQWFHEYNKPDNEVDDNVLSTIEWELRLLGNAFTSAAGVPRAKDKP